MTADQLCYIDFASGDQQDHDDKKKRYDELVDWLVTNGANYGLQTSLGEFDDVGRESLIGIYQGVTQITLDPSSLSPPPSLLLPRLTIRINRSLNKTSDNFLTLLTNLKPLKSKKNPKIDLKYQGSQIHRIENDFIAQGGDLTRGDGSGGESIWGGTFNDEKEGLKVAFEQGTIAMANSGKNSNSSQYFITLASDPTKLRKLTGKYVAFGQVVLKPEHDQTSSERSREDSKTCLARLNELGDGQGGTKEKVWIHTCGLL